MRAKPVTEPYRLRGNHQLSLVVMISLSPCREVNVSTTKVSKINEEVIRKELWLDIEHYKKLLNWIDEQDNSIFIKMKEILPVLILTGVRREELLGLKWSSVDFNNRTIRIVETIVKGKRDIRSDRTKTLTSIRTIVMFDKVYEALMKLKERQIELGIYSEYNNVFVWEDGEYIGQSYQTDYITKLFKKLVRRCPYVDSNLHLHLTRHSCASILFELGWDLTDVQKYLGHSDSEVTRKIYIHYKDKIDSIKYDKINSVFNKL